MDCSVDSHQKPGNERANQSCQSPHQGCRRRRRRLGCPNEERRCWPRPRPRRRCLLTRPLTTGSGAMPPSPTDTVAARLLSDAIVLAGRDRIRRVMLFGSRARGLASASSDFDFLVLIEPPVGVRWSPADNVAERRRLLSRLPPSTISVEMWVRTLDQFAEAARVVGTPEQAARSHGLVLYSRPADRPSVVRRSAALVRAQCATDWVEGAVALLARAAASERAMHATASRLRVAERDATTGASALSVQVAPSDVTEDSLTDSALRWACSALCVLYSQPLPPKRDHIDAALDRIRRFAPAIGASIRDALQPHGNADARARRVVRLIAARVSREPLAPLLRDAARRSLED
jgi:predicted nucleotidyltransferase